MKNLDVVRGVKLPVDLAAHVTLIAGKRGSGKTNTAKRLIEQAIRAGVPVAILDPADVWWGLRAGRDGSAAGGLPIHVFGGRHGDLRLEPGAGALIADVIIEQRVSVVMALREFSGAERARFVTDFANRLIQKNTEPLLVVAEEAHELMPQGKTMGQESVSLGAMLRLVTLGRSSGLALVQVTQRLARLNKTATTQSDVLFAHRTIGPQDRDALEEWIKYHHAGSHRAEFMQRLPELKTGEAWLWAPDFPEDKPIGLQAVTVLECETFNSHATPKVGEVRRQPKALAPVDLERLRTKMADTIERQKAEDPKALRAELAKAKADLAKAEKRSADLADEVEKVQASAKPVQVRVVIEEDTDILRDSAATIATLVDRLQKAAMHVHESIRIAAEETAAEERRLRPAAAHVPSFSLAKGHRPEPTSVTVTRALPVRRGSGQGEKMARVERKILIALAQYPAGRSKTQVAILTGYAHNGGGFNNGISALRTRAWLDGSGDRLQITEAGLAALGDFEALPSGDALRQHWLAQLGKAERLILEALCEAYPCAVGKEDLGARTGYEPNGGGFNNALSRLRSLELIGGRGEMKASDDLFG